MQWDKKNLRILANEKSGSHMHSPVLKHHNTFISSFSYHDAGFSNHCLSAALLSAAWQHLAARHHWLSLSAMTKKITVTHHR